MKHADGTARDPLPAVLGHAPRAPPSSGQKAEPSSPRSSPRRCGSPRRRCHLPGALLGVHGKIGPKGALEGDPHTSACVQAPRVPLGILRRRVQWASADDGGAERRPPAWGRARLPELLGRRCSRDWRVIPALPGGSHFLKRFSAESAGPADTVTGLGVRTRPQPACRESCRWLPAASITAAQGSLCLPGSGPVLGAASVQ